MSELLWVAWGLTGITWCLVIVSSVFDDVGGDLWRALAVAALCGALLSVGLALWLGTVLWVHFGPR